MNSSMACAARFFAEAYIDNAPLRGPNATLHIFTSEGPGLSAGFWNATISFSDGCPRTGIMPQDPSDGTDDVVTVSELGDPALGGYTLWMSNCDMTSVFNVTKTGVYVIKGGLAYLIPERKPGGVCGGPDQIAYQTASLADYCRANATLAECSKIAPDPATSAATTPFKRQSVVALLGVLLTLTASVAL